MLPQGGDPNRSTAVMVVLAVGSTLFFVVVLVALARDLLWMLIVILPAIWLPAIVPFISDPNDERRQRRLLMGSVVLGALVVVGRLMATMLLGVV